MRLFLNNARVRWIRILAVAFGLLGGALGASVLEGRASAAIKVHGAAVDDNAKKVGESRFRSAEDWEKTVRFYRNVYGGKAGIVWSTIDTPPKVKAIHIANTLPKRTWEGINIYEVNGDIFIYIIPVEVEGKAEKR